MRKRLKKGGFLDVLVGDECNIQHEPNGTNQWSEVGNTPIIKVNRARDKKHKVSVFGALSITSGKVLAMFCPWLNFETAIQFLERVKAHRNRLLKKMKSKPFPVLLIWDNASFHKKKEVRIWLAKNPGVVELMNFPTYCPERESPRACVESDETLPRNPANQRDYIQ